MWEKRDLVVSVLGAFGSWEGFLSKKSHASRDDIPKEILRTSSS